jgi:hypothetical protein
MNDELQSSRYSLSEVPRTGSPIVPTPPKSSITLIDPWVVWEYTACLFTGDIKFETKDLHDAIKAHAQNQNLPVNIFYDSSAHWIIEGAWGRAKVDDDRRPRVTMNLRNSRYSDMQFITGIDYFGECWANFQMMMVVQPETLERPPKPVDSEPLLPNEPSVPLPLLPTEALVVLAVVAIGLLFTGNPGIQILGFVGLVGGLVIWAISSQNVRQAEQRYNKWKEDTAKIELEERELRRDRHDKWKEKITKIELEEIELKQNRLSRSFKSDDLFVFHEVASKIVSAVVFNALLKKGGRVEQSNENTRIENVIPKSKKDIFDNF